MVREEEEYPVKDKMLLSLQDSEPYQIEDEDKLKTEPGGGDNTVKKASERHLRSAFAKYKKWDAAEISKLEKLGEGRILVNDCFVVEVEYENYIKEDEVFLELDEDWKTCEMPPLPAPTAPNCQAPPCRLGCVCDSIATDTIARKHCGKLKCIFECTCLGSLYGNGDDGDIRSRLRPRVSLLNWRYMESTEREKDAPTNYRQLERGSNAYPRMRRIAVTPQRFRTEFIMSQKFQEKDKRTPVGSSSLKFIRNKQLGKREVHSNLYRQNPSLRKESLPAKLRKCKPCTVPIDAIKRPERTPVLFSSKNTAASTSFQPPLPVPNLIQILVEDGQIILIGESMCYFAWTIHSKQPRTVIYEAQKGDVSPIPWLYVPIPSHGETWVVHQLSEHIEGCHYTYIPEINCIIPTKALLMHFNIVKTKKKGMALKLLWIGEDSKKRMGSIYLLPELPGILLCGPFPKDQIRQRNSISTEKIDNALNLNSYIDGLTKKRRMGDDRNWNAFFAKSMYHSKSAFKENVLKQRPKGVKTCDKIPEETFIKMLPGFSNAPVEHSHSMDDRKPRSRNIGPVKSNDKLRVSWTDAARLLSVRPQIS